MRCTVSISIVLCPPRDIANGDTEGFGIYARDPVTGCGVYGGVTHRVVALPQVLKRHVVY